MERPRISVYVITYNQEDVIHRTMESLLSQKDYIYEICINDDCSKDRTFDILQEYEHQYPNLVKPVQNEHNLGIFANFEAVWKRVSGDIVYTVSGDDEAGEGFFKAILDFIDEKSIDWKNELFCIYGDYRLVYPNGDCFVFSNKMAVEPNKAVRYTLMGMVGNRGCCFSVKVLRCFQDVSQGKSHIAETAQDIQLPFFTQQFYHLPYVGNIYHAGIGVSAKIDEETAKEREKIVPYAFDFLGRNGYKIGKQERAYCNYNIAVKRMHRKAGGMLSVIYWYLCTYFVSCKVLKKSLKSRIFSIRHKLPHKKPLDFSF